MINTKYCKYEFPSEFIFNSLFSNIIVDNMVIIGNIENKFYVDILWTTTEYLQYTEYQIYPGIDTQHSFLGHTDYNYNLEINDNLGITIPYPNFINKDVTILEMDNLHKLIRETPISNKGIKSIKYYKYNEKLIWSIESIYWFETNNPKFNENGIVKIHTWYSKEEEPLITTERFIPMSFEDKEKELKVFRENAISYLKSKNVQLFDMLYTFFSNDIIEYISTGNKTKFAYVLTDASINNQYEPYPGIFPVRDTLLMVIAVINGNEINVLNGILYELL